MNKKDLLTCRVCGLEQADYPWGEDGYIASFEICPCCGVEFGYEDSTLEGIHRKREEWKKGGYKWIFNKQKPSHWNPEIQLLKIPKIYL